MWFQSQDIQENIHLVDCDALGLGKEEERPSAGDQHPARKEKPCAVAEGGKHVWQRLGHDKLDQP